MRHLRGRGVQHVGLRRAAGVVARRHVRLAGRDGEDARVPRPDYLRQHDARQHVGALLDQRARHGDRRSPAELGVDLDVDRHAELHALDQLLQPDSGVQQRADHAQHHGEYGPLAQGLGRPEHDRRHLDLVVDGPAARALRVVVARGVGHGVRPQDAVEARLWDVLRVDDGVHDVQVLEGVLQSRQVDQVPERRRPALSVQAEHVERAGAADGVDPFGVHEHVELGLLAGEREPARRARERLAENVFRHADDVLVEVHGAPAVAHRLQRRTVLHPHPHLAQHAQHRAVHPLDVLIAEELELSALEHRYRHRAALRHRTARIALLIPRAIAAQSSSE